MRNFTIRQLPALLFATVVAAAPPLHAQVYKWVDEKGVTHYSESPPEKDKDKSKAKKIDTTPATGNAPGGTPKAAKSASDMELEFRQRQNQRDQQSRNESQQRERQQANCADARRNLARYQEQVSLFRRNDKGEREYIEDRERQAEISRTQSYIDRNC